jgi:protein gp37
MGLTPIEWTGYTWNPIKDRLIDDLLIQLKNGTEKTVPAGTWGYHCERVSPGCCNCYACSMNGRTLPHWGTGLDYTVPNRDKVKIFLDQEVLKAPLGRRKPSKIFPASMTDWCASFVPDEFRDSMIAIGALTPAHTYQYLTKRADTLARYVLEAIPLSGRDELVAAQASHTGNIVWDARGSDRHAYFGCGQIGDISNRRVWPGWPLRNIQLGVSIEDQQRANERREAMKAIAAAGWFTWVSYEPALENVDWTGWEFIRWMVIGGESGPGARPFDLRFARNALAWCRKNNVVPFVKQLGAFPVEEREKGSSPVPLNLKDKKGGDIEEWAHDLRVRELPEAA